MPNRVDSELYCLPVELQLGQLRMQIEESDRKHYIEKASDEIDSYISALYLTPIQVGNTPEGGLRTTSLILNQICSELASGRAILSTASSSQDMQVHAYGKWLVERAFKRIEQIVKGEVVLPGVKPADTEEVEAKTAGPIVVNVSGISDQSIVKAFYDRNRLGTLPGDINAHLRYGGDAGY